MITMYFLYNFSSFDPQISDLHESYIVAKPTEFHN